MKKLFAFVVGELALLALPVQAQQFPAHAISFIVPFPAGGPSDALGRVVAHSMSGTLGAKVGVENLTGAGGTLGRAKAAQARPDGYTILLADIGQAVSATLYRKLPYDPVAAFDMIGLIAEVPMVIVGRKDLPVKGIVELISYIKENKDKVTYGNGGLGSGSHFCGLLFMNALQTKMTTVSYRGSAPAMLDVLAGRLDILCDQTTTTMGNIQTGRIKAYAVTTKARVLSMPEQPTLDESGLRDFHFAVWYGLAVPRGTPRPIVDQFASTLRAALSDPDVSKRLTEFGAQPVSLDRAAPAASDAYLRAEVAKWAPIIRAAGVYAD